CESTNHLDTFMSVNVYDAANGDKATQAIPAICRPSHCGICKSPKTIRLDKKYTLGPGSSFRIKNLGNPYNGQYLCRCNDKAEFRIKEVSLCDENECTVIPITGDSLKVYGSGGELIVQDGFQETKEINKVIIKFDGYTSTWIRLKFNPTADNDEDGFLLEDDCNDNDADIYPGADEICDGKKNNCNAEDESLDRGCDSDLDSYIDESKVCKQGARCIDNNGNELSPASDCHSWCNNLDCADGNPNRHPGAAELCIADGDTNLVDDDCDGSVNEGCAGQSIADCENNEGVWVGLEDETGGCCKAEDQYFTAWYYVVPHDDFSACWNGNPRKNLRIADYGTLKKALHYNGSWYGCDAAGTGYFTHVSLNNFNNGANTGDGLCRNIGDPSLGYRYCSYDGQWKSADGKLSQEIKSDPSGSSLECCPDDYCWNGTACKKGTSLSPGVDLTTSAGSYKCVEGAWEGTEIKYDQNRAESAECGLHQCYYFDPVTDTGMCVPDRNYTMDDYCNNGNWTTRTAIVAMNLLNLTKNLDRSSYTLHCDRFTRALNDPQYFVGSTPYNATEWIIGPQQVMGLYGCEIDCPTEDCPCLNNFCVLEYTDLDSGERKVAFGVSTNLPIDSPSPNNYYSLLNIIPESEITYATEDDHFDFCDSVIDSGEDRYMGCNRYDDPIQGTETEIWYNPDTASLIYSPDGITMGKTGFSKALYDFVTHPINTMINSLSNTDQTTHEFVQSHTFDRLYVNKKGAKSVTGFVDEETPEMQVMYKNFYTSICSIIDDMEDRLCLFGSGCIDCNPVVDDSGMLYRVATDDPYVIGIEDYDGIWDDLTSKIRITKTELADLVRADILDENSITAQPIDWENHAGMPYQLSISIPDSDEFEIKSYNWDFGDGNNFYTTQESRGEEVLYVFSEPGTYTTSFILTDSLGRWDKAEKEIIVEAYAEGEPCITNEMCQSGFCTGNISDPGVCTDSTCNDGLKGPLETDIDCGGICTSEDKRCDYGQSCSIDDDCKGELCKNGMCTPAVITCTVSSTCEETSGDNNQISVFKISGLTNAHAENSTEDNYDYHVCCSVEGDRLGHRCYEGGNGDIALRLSGSTNAHATGNKTDSRYPEKVCLSAQKGRIQCGVSAQCGLGGVEIVSLSGLTNAHLGDLNAYSLKLCCGYYSVGDGLCGNNVLEQGEECDDGNTMSGDGCDSDCMLECGNGEIEGAEECDDGNRIDDDGCDSQCRIECGNGEVEGAEQCDDGNNANGDGCNETCEVELYDYLGLLQEYWSLDEGSGITAQGINGNDGELMNDAQFISEGYSGSAVYFDGSYDRITTAVMTNQTPTSPGLTMIAWAKPDRLQATYRNIISTNNGGNDWSIFQYSDTWRIHTGASRWNTEFEVDEDQWQHLAAVYDNTRGKIRFYKNGQEVEYTFVAGQTYTDQNTGAVTIGGNPYAATNTFFGTIDEVQVYNGALSADDIMNNYIYWSKIKNKI
ncbi:PKD domain-containing protein, partial [Candidatus Woesearchaeota archaeon]|nr:PKD domain-containing protein [Candidatus Woesearchaeota archaeon]